MLRGTAERERLTRTIAEDRTELRRAVRDLGLSVLLGMDLPKRIRRRPLPWVIGALSLGTLVVLARQRSKRSRREESRSSEVARS